MKKEAASAFCTFMLQAGWYSCDFFRLEEDADPVGGIQRVRDDGTGGKVVDLHLLFGPWVHQVAGNVLRGGNAHIAHLTREVACADMEAAACAEILKGHVHPRGNDWEQVDAPRAAVQQTLRLFVNDVHQLVIAGDLLRATGAVAWLLVLTHACEYIGKRPLQIKDCKRRFFSFWL